MGSLARPSTGLVYLDASAFIYSVELIGPYRPLLEPVWQQAQAGQFSVVSSELVVLETLVRPLREADEVVKTFFLSLSEANVVRLISTARSLWEETTRLRADAGSKPQVVPALCLTS